MKTFTLLLWTLGCALLNGQELPKRLVFSWISNQERFASQLTVQNFAQGDVVVRLVALRGDGSSASATRTIAAQGLLVESADSLFPALGFGSGFSVVVESESSLIDGRWITFNRQAGSGASPGSAGAVRLAERFQSAPVLLGDSINLGYFPLDSTFFSIPVVVNLGTEAIDVVLRAFATDGSLVLEDRESMAGLLPFRPYAMIAGERLAGFGPGVTMTASCSGGLLSGAGFIFNQAGEPAIANATALRPPLPPVSKVFAYDFADGAQDWNASFADYPEGEDLFYELESGIRALPETVGTGTGFVLSGNNHSDDLCMYAFRRVDGLEPNRNYAIEWKIELGSNGISGCPGVGGSPGDSVYFKAGALGIEPTRVVFEGNWLTSFDKGNQGQGGKDLALLGTIGVAGDCEAPAYARKTIQSSLPTEVKSDAQGQAWLVVATDSGFEATTTLYLKKVEAYFYPM